MITVEDYVFVLMMKERSYTAENPIILTAVDSNNTQFLFDVAERNAIKFEEDYDVICYTFKKGRIKEISIYNIDLKDFDIITEIEE